MLFGPRCTGAGIWPWPWPYGWPAPHLLLLDEPTDHLSPRLCDELGEALGTDGPGAIVVASCAWNRIMSEGRGLGAEAGVTIALCWFGTA